MKNLPIKYSNRAKFDLDDIWFSLASTNIELADRFVDQLELQVNGLMEFPNCGVLRTDMTPNMRILVEGKYLVLYQIRDSMIVIVRIVHGARDLGDLDFT